MTLDDQRKQIPDEFAMPKRREASFIKNATKADSTDAMRIGTAVHLALNGLRADAEMTPEVIARAIFTETERQKFEAATRATDPQNLLAKDFSRHEVSRGYSGYIAPQTEAAFCGWMLAKLTGEE